MSKVVVTGGSGFCGQAVVQELDRQGYEVFVCSDSDGVQNFLGFFSAEALRSHVNKD